MCDMTHSGQPWYEGEQHKDNKELLPKDGQKMDSVMDHVRSEQRGLAIG